MDVSKNVFLLNIYILGGKKKSLTCAFINPFIDVPLMLENIYVSPFQPIPLLNSLALNNGENNGVEFTFEKRMKAKSKS